MKFWDCLKQKYDWENEDLDLGEGKVEEELVSKFTHIPAEIPGVRMAAHVQPDTEAVQAPLVPTMSYLAAAATADAGFAPTTGVSQPTGVGSTDVVDLTDATDDNDDTETIAEPKVEYIHMEDVVEEREKAQALTVKFGGGMRIRTLR